MTTSSGANSERAGELVPWLLQAGVGAMVSGLYLYYGAVISWQVAHRYDGDSPLWWLAPVVVVGGSLAAAARLGSNGFASWGVRALFAVLTGGVFVLYLHAHLDELAYPVLQWVWPAAGVITGTIGLQIARLALANRPTWLRPGRAES